ncbi:MAG: hypothetical protein IAE91_00690, partial [Ignavibacteriaceae bacterium]|nr:hypothetical protein [Ignavibacteriaceae bacterium]
MITELANYFDSIRGERDYLLFTEGKLPQGYYYCFDLAENETNGFKLSYEFEIKKKNEILIHESAVYNDRDILSYLKKSEFLKKLFLSRTISSNKTIIQQIYTSNPALIYYNSEKLLNLNASLDRFYNYSGVKYLAVSYTHLTLPTT